MSESVILSTAPGEVVTDRSRSFVVRSDLADLAKSAAEAGFRWQWLLAGDAFRLTPGSMARFASRAVCTSDGAGFRMLTLPDAADRQYLYLGAAAGDVVFELAHRRNWFRRQPRPPVGGLRLNADFAFTINLAYRLDTQGTPDATSRVEEWGTTFGAAWRS